MIVLGNQGGSPAARMEEGCTAVKEAADSGGRPIKLLNHAGSKEWPSWFLRMAVVQSLKIDNKEDGCVTWSRLELEKLPRSGSTRELTGLDWVPEPDNWQAWQLLRTAVIQGLKIDNEEGSCVTWARLGC